MCSGHGSVASLVPLIFWYIFPLSLLMVELYGLDWEVSVIFTYIIRLYPPLDLGPYDLPPLEVYSYPSLAGLGGWKVYPCLGF